jgi:hypothetical protein
MAKPKPYPWRTVYRADLKAATGLGDDSIETNILGKLPKNLYWFKPFGSNRVLYNLDLIRDFLALGQCPAHQKAVQRFLACIIHED